MKIPILDLKAQYKSIQKEIDNAIKTVIAESAFIGGRHVEELEKNIAAYCGTKYAVALNSGTDALYLALWALGIGEGDEVITSPFSFFATAEVIAKVGAKPVFVDIDPTAFNIDPDLIKAKITKKTKAIIPVHLFGQAAEMDKINALAKKHKFFVIEDACQAIGATYKGKKTGNLGDIGAFSFFPSKNLGAYGDGGIVTTNNKDLADKIRQLRNHGSKVKYYNDEIGVSSRLDGIQAAILNAKLKHLDKWNKARNNVAKTYAKLMKNVSGIILPNNENCKLKIEHCQHVFHQYTIRVKNGKRDELKKYLADKGIQTMIYYPVPLHLLKAMEYLGYKKGSLPEAEKACSEVLSLPIYPELKNKTITQIGKILSNL
ncbi:transcriptional regulator [Candidatus Roizmanbacteria bacterium RIFOXYB2_FULL_38_10]|uniref:Transcriptional regulator n=1 Tax=Candidatus Roizmanbacteria bacterium RIFOXYD1_FULL_38_12 TaxID=1802093 RepID=A0A1F7L0R7_9BACT|nr:MAG: transcriptional regulator [Candidatus Roizmanbacteria bacterium RIFOXYA2_FULL_38_14]OGK63734.1 MAG: transcriptional regulator [Candidatus Roizmanbacteria bacterium RIFOXYA1_FULL_37_12]OGK65580.1 MAG: transcriptional regulator [Candidatus Roizmanbacteria bacterium RIFOXYB1_FULL_40_23]OGK68364.1 MAG: transcriptional regulator [Candidatus Roizmanbacteria bacterium RIFOXYB2_FULL_38_10]OGK69985.1 MAG: transcriptional regulator [Candidatus Roizmanbacteria bacterium RIFOXYC1_FULL_38_14]OGK737